MNQKSKNTKGGGREKIWEGGGEEIGERSARQAEGGHGNMGRSVRKE